MPVTEAAASADLSLDAFDKPAGFYVYLLIDPRSDSLFYVGKGNQQRLEAYVEITGSLKAIVSKLEMELNPASLNV